MADNIQDTSKPMVAPPGYIDASANSLYHEVQDSLRGNDETSDERIADDVLSEYRLGTLGSIATKLEKDGAEVTRDEDGDVSEIQFSDAFGRQVDIDISDSGEVTVNGKNREELQEQAANEVLESCSHNLDSKVKSGELTADEASTLNSLYRGVLTGDSELTSAAAREILGGDSNKLLAQANRDLSLRLSVETGIGGEQALALTHRVDRTQLQFAADGSVRSYETDANGTADYNQRGKYAATVMHDNAESARVLGGLAVQGKQLALAGNVLYMGHDALFNNNGQNAQTNMESLQSQLSTLPDEQLKDVAQLLEHGDQLVYRNPTGGKYGPTDNMNVDFERDEAGNITSIMFEGWQNQGDSRRSISVNL